ncbi:hypothetical protein DL769_011600 [Monosporascus sp. CRB-8-3]|nr:hypothetical protein DL769_011600 [Monosporascus sp. CRB-8-3]
MGVFTSPSEAKMCVLGGFVCATGHSYSTSVDPHAPVSAALGQMPWKPRTSRQKNGSTLNATPNVSLRNAAPVVLDDLMLRNDVFQVGVQADVCRGGALGDAVFSHPPASPSEHGLVRGAEHDEPPSGPLRDRVPRLVARDELDASGTITRCGDLSPRHARPANPARQVALALILVRLGVDQQSPHNERVVGRSRLERYMAELLNVFGHPLILNMQLGVQELEEESDKLRTRTKRTVPQPHKPSVYV